MLLVALTGNVAAGKSTVAFSLRAHGATIIDADAAARSAVAIGTPALARIVARFGATILQPDGSLDRAALGRVVFRDAGAREQLEQIVHPAVQAARESEVTNARAAGAAIVVCDIPLLFEAKLAWQFPRIILVDAPLQVRIARMVETRGLSQANATERALAQLSSSLKRPRADLVLENNANLPALHMQIDRAWQRLLEWAPVAQSNRAA